MNAAISPDEWNERFPDLARLNPLAKQLLLSRSAKVEVPAGTMIFGPGNSPENILYLLGGTVQ